MTDHQSAIEALLDLLPIRLHAVRCPQCKKAAGDICIIGEGEETDPLGWVHRRRADLAVAMTRDALYQLCAQG